MHLSWSVKQSVPNANFRGYGNNAIHTIAIEVTKQVNIPEIPFDRNYINPKGYGF